VKNYTSITKERIVEVLTGYLTEDRHFQVIATPPVKKKED
jgi:hypothetical protein